MAVELGTSMVRVRISEAEDKEAARILEMRRARREELLAQARENPKPRRSFIITWFRGRRTIAAI